MKHKSEMADHFFPIKDKNGRPSYRGMQKEVILRILELFEEGTKCVILDAPVGSGKSVINYTVSRCLGSGVYLTPQKQLQDQIARENWKSVKMVKGRSAYVCNHCSDDIDEIRCTYTGDKFEMCNNSSTGYNKGIGNEVSIKDSISKTLRMYSGNENRRRARTSFEPGDDVDKLFKDVTRFIHDNTPPEMPPMTFPIQKTIGCLKEAIECSVKSAKMLAKMFHVRVLNPDIFYQLTRNSPDYFGAIDLMVVDECHTLENVISRIFKTKLPLDTIKRLSGLDLFDLCDVSNSEEFVTKFNKLKKDEIDPMLIAAKIFNDMGDVSMAHNYTSMCGVQSHTEYAGILALSKDAINRGDQRFSVINLANLAFSNKADKWFEHNPDYKHFENFVRYIRNEFVLECKEKDCKETFDINTSLVLTYGKYASSRRTHDSDGRHFANYMIELKNAMGSAFDKVSALINIKRGNFRTFVFSVGKLNTIKLCASSEFEPLVKSYLGREDEDTFIEIVPVAIGTLLKMFFFDFSKHVLLSTGTWVNLDKTISTFGLLKKECKYIKVPSTFPKNRRPVYILDNPKYTNFSERGDDYEYVYKTEDGIKKFTAELADIVSSIKNYIRDRHSINPNIIIHSHTFYISRQLARYGSFIDNKYLIHIGANDEPIRNENTGHLSIYRHKDELVKQLRENPNSGLVLVSASVSEGMDFKNGIARAQIILKTPIPYVMDPYVKAIAKGNEELGIFPDRDYFDRICLTTIGQQYGRIMRSEEDWGYTFIIDQAATGRFKNWLSRYNQHKLPIFNLNYFFEAIKIQKYQYGMPVFSWLF